MEKTMNQTILEQAYQSALPKVDKVFKGKTFTKEILDRANDLMLAEDYSFLDKYHTTLETCECDYSTYNPKHFCKHQVCLMLQVKALRLDISETISISPTPKAVRYIQDGSGYYMTAEQFKGYYFLHAFVSLDDCQEFIDNPNSATAYSKIVHPKSVTGHRKSPIYH
jgi:hypothetical protein